jgi:uncharacterized phage protein gp47/JayE
MKTTKQIGDEVVSDVGAGIGQQVPSLAKSFVRVLGKSFGGLYAILYRYGGFIFLQQYPATATMRETTILGKKRRPLVDWGRLIGLPDPVDAVRPELVIGVNVKLAVGELKAGSILLHQESGVLYTTSYARPLSDAVTTTVEGVQIQELEIKVRANVAGAIGNRVAGDVLCFAQPIGNVGTDARVISTVKSGADAEAQEDYRRKVLGHGRRTPEGGSIANYDAWAREVPGIVGVYPYAGHEIESDGSLNGWVYIYVQADEASSGNPDGIPTTAQLTAVYNHVHWRGGVNTGKPNRKPIGARIKVLPIARLDFGLEVAGLRPSTPENQAAIVDRMTTFLHSRRPFIEGLSVLPREDLVANAEVSGVVVQAAHARGATVTSTRITPGPSYQLQPGELAKLGPSVSWIT